MSFWLPLADLNLPEATVSASQAFINFARLKLIKIRIFSFFPAFDLPSDTTSLD